MVIAGGGSSGQGHCTPGKGGEGQPAVKGERLTREEGREELPCNGGSAQPSPTSENQIMYLHSKPSIHSFL